MTGDLHIINAVDIGEYKEVRYQVTGFQMLEHMCTLHDWLPGKIMVAPHRGYRGACRWLVNNGYQAEQTSVKDMRAFVRDPANAVIFFSGGFFKSVAKRIYPNTYSMGHGVSEKCSYGYMGKAEISSVSRASCIPPLLFGRHINGTQEITLDTLQRVFDIDPNKPTVVYMTTFGGFSMFKHGILQALAGLKDRFNIIVKPHYLVWTKHRSAARYIAANICPIDPALHPPMPFLDLADVVIGDISGGTLPALFFNEKPLLYSMPAAARKHSRELTISDSEAIIITEEDVGRLGELLTRAVSDEAEGKEKAAARKALFRRWFGYVDGQTGKRVLEAALGGPAKGWNERYETLMMEAEKAHERY